VVAIGGGTGLSTLLRGLRRHVASSSQGVPDEGGLIADLAAVVTVTDDGGSSGRLRKDFNMLPPGDLRNCMVALSEEEDMLTRLSGDFARAIQLASKILATRGHIYPVTTANATLVARMDDGSMVRGETKITASRKRIAELMLDPPDAAPLPETLEAIERADLISVGPGSLYTSLICNLLVQGMPAALAKARGLRVYICNLMTQANESLGLTASQHIERIYEHTRAPIFDYALVNTGAFSPETLARYAAEGAYPITPDIERIEALGVRVIPGHFASEENVVRHNADCVANALLALCGTTLAERG
jgi:uncharacterized cofD-like protein